MRHLAVLTAALALVAGLVVPVAADPAPAGYASDNVDWLGTIPIDSPGVGARVVPVGDQIRLYVSGVKGFSLYDVTAPASPQLLGTLPLPHWENEDISVSADGNTALISVESGSTVLFVLDTSNPRLPRIASVLDSGSHTATCVDAACDWIYTSSGYTYDLRDKAAPVKLAKGWKAVAEEQGVVFRQRAHDLNLDAAGIVTTDTVPRVMLDPSDPVAPKVLTTGSPGGVDLAYQHNNLRPDADAYKSMPAGSNAPLKAGEILLSNGETNFTGTCDGGSGPFATWSVRGFDRGEPMRVLDVYRPVTGDYADGNPAVNALGCSGHWFSERDGLVAAGWYEHGTRILDVDEQTGAITEVGFFQPVVGSASAAHWVDDEHVYVIDYERGIDILHVDRDPGKRPGRAEIERSWMAKLGVVSPVAERERTFCQLAI